VVLKPGDPVWLSLHGEWAPGSVRRLVAPEIAQLLNDTARHPSAAAQVGSGLAMDYAYEATVDRFRVNATQCRTARGVGIELTLRSLPGLPPALADMNLPPELQKALFPLYGLVLVTGPTGSGKTTLLASTLAHSARTRPRRILTHEAPVEFDLDGIPDRPRHPDGDPERPPGVPGDPAGGRSASRKSPSILGTKQRWRGLKAMIIRPVCLTTRPTSCSLNDSGKVVCSPRSG
jgi:defect-in-organelle-trafficking protein DotB